MTSARQNDFATNLHENIFTRKLGMKKIIAISTLIFASTAALAQVDIFASLDVDKDGRISIGEASANKEVFAAFDALDADKDGFLSASELQD